MKKLLFLVLFIPLLTEAQNITTVASGLDGPVGITADTYNNLYITTGFVYGYGRVLKANSAGIINVIAGCLSGCAYAASGPATSIYLYNPAGIAVDNSGNVYIAEQTYNSVRKVNDSGIISVVAGHAGGSFGSGYSGDNGPATNAELSNPFGVAIDKSGNVYIADELNQRIRKIDTSGTITTIAGNGISGYSGDGGPATAAQFYDPYGVAVDKSGNVYIADTHNDRIRKINSSGIITTIAGSNPVGVGGYSGDGGAATDAELFYPAGIALDSAGNIYIADQSNNRIREVNTLGLITTIAGTGIEGFAGDGGAATAAELSQPTGLAVDNTGTIYFADRGNNRIRKIARGCPMPLVAPVSGIDTVFIDSVILLTEIASGGFWSSSDSAIALVSAGSVTGLTAGTDTIKYSVNDDCGTVTAEKVIYVVAGNAPSGIDNRTTSMPNITVYPNPAGDLLTVAASCKITSIAVSDLLGQIISSQTCDGEKVQVNIAGLSAGIYFVQLNGSIVRKFVKG